MINKRIIALITIGLMILLMFGCSSEKSTQTSNINLEDGEYWVEFNTDSSMFHINEAMEGKAVMTVANKEAVVNIIMPSKKIVKLYLGMAEDAQKEGADLIEAVVTEVTYQDGTTDEVNSFNVPVPCLNEEFDLALVGTKGTWYDHKVSVTNPVPYEEVKASSETETENSSDATNEATASDHVMVEGETGSIELSLEGGSGKAYIESPAPYEVTQDGIWVTLVWSSPNYDYMIVDGVRYEPINEDGNSTFKIPVTDFSQPLDVIADTVAMSTPHEIEYTITFDTGSMLVASADFKNQQKLKYAKEFKIDYLDDGNIFVTIADGDEYMIITSDNAGTYDTEAWKKKIKESDATVIFQGSDSVYLAASSAMDLVVRLGALDNIKFCSTKAEDYYLEEARKRIQAGRIKYIGKYSAPDYETLLGDQCDLAIESTMIYHSPKIKETLEDLGIPVLVERSSYESNPLGRLEWIKLYGILLGKEAEAENFFDEQERKVLDVINSLNDRTNANGENSNENLTKVAIFYVSSNGYINVRKSGDYLTKMLEIAGGEYALKNLIPEEENALSTMNISVEDFYREAKNADILIYNGTIDGGISSIEDLVAKSELFADFKAVTEGKVYCTNMNIFQESSAIAPIIEDFYHIINEENVSDLKYLYSVE